MTKAKPSSDKEDLREEGEEERGECCDLFMVKNVVYFFNFLLLLSGAAILGIGLWTIIAKHTYVALLASTVYQATSYLLVLTGVLLVVVIFGLGCFGAWRENTRCLTIYVVLLIVIFVLEIICGTLAYIYEAQIHDELKENLKYTMINKYHHNELMVEIDDLQKTFRCCGGESFRDWVDSQMKVPDSCCKTPSYECSSKSHHPSNINYKGCVDGLSDFLQRHLVILGAIGLGLCCLQLLGIIFTCWLIKKIKDKNEALINHWR